MLSLGIPGFTYADLHSAEKLKALYEAWCAELCARDAALAARYEAFRRAPGAIEPVTFSELLVEVAPHVSRFVARLFGVTPERERLLAETRALSPIFKFKDQVVKRRAWKRGAVPWDDAVDAQARTLELVTGVGYALRVVKLTLEDRAEVKTPAGLAPPAQLKPGDRVRVEYTKSADGNTATAIEVLPPPEAGGAP